MSERRDLLVPASEVALGLVTITAIVGMHRLFEDGSYFGPMVQQAIVAHLVVTALRRLRVGLVPAALATAAAATLFITWTRFPGTTHWMLPTGATVTRLADDLGAAWTLFGDVRAPAPVENGFLAATAAAIWLIVYIADWAAFRTLATFEALLPATTLFVFAAALGSDGSAVAAATLFAGAALLFVLLHRTANQERSLRWAGGQRDQGRWSLVATGAGLIGATMVAAAVTGPRLPGADAEPVVAWRDIARDEPMRVVLSPMVSLQTKLVEQPALQVFTVRSDRSSYWRLTSLDEFDGEIWRSSYSTEDAAGELPRALDPATTSQSVTQEVTINALSSVWLPAAYEPVAVDPRGQATDYDERSSTLMVDRDVLTSDGYTYTVTSQLPDWSADELRAASPEVPAAIRTTYLQLPEEFPQAARTEGQRLTNDQPTPFDKALAIQTHLRTFTYDQNVGPGHSDEALIDFLFRTRRGYCEQFSAAFAALARAAGLPARVAVGFTPGVQDPNDPTLYRVFGVHAHAWPEVYLGEFGWVPFEPTPTRGPPRADTWLGINESQDTSGGGAAVTDPDAGSGAGAGAGDTAGTGPSGDEQGGGGLLGEDAFTASAGDSKDDSPALPKAVTDASRPLGLGVLAYVTLVPLAIAGQRTIRRRRASTASAKVSLWWRTTTEAAERAGVELPPSLTIREKADRLATALPRSGAAIQGLARSMETIAYAESAPPADEVVGMEHAWAETVTQVKRRQPWTRRVLSYLDARRLVARRRSRLVAHVGSASAS
ncbi:MAG TPA: DUF3488 and transglutaminase-like domain-containing protein [Acidimicrobiales bacterium]